MHDQPSMKFANVEIPSRMSSLKKDARGYPIPANILVDVDGRPYFSINAEEKRQKFIKEDRCPICSGKLLRGRWSVGGPASAFHEAGAYLDSPMHYECVRYALQVCPYLAMPKYLKRIDDKLVDWDKVPGIIATINPTTIDNRPDPFVLVMHVGQHFVHGDDGSVSLIVPHRPHRKYEFWSNGRQLPESEGMEKAMAYMQANQFD